MVNRADLERLIVLGLDELRRAEADFESRFRKERRCRKVQPRGEWPILINSVDDLRTRADRLEALLAALERNESRSPVAA